MVWSGLVCRRASPLNNDSLYIGKNTVSQNISMTIYGYGNEKKKRTYLSSRIFKWERNRLVCNLKVPQSDTSYSEQTSSSPASTKERKSDMRA
jgi:hypothetical protein